MEKRSNMRVSFVAAAIIWTSALAIVSAQQAEKKVWDGVYTSAQAARGKAPFERACGRCHNNELAGSQRGPALKGNVFWSKWDNDTLGDLYMKIRDTMPQDGPSLVEDAQKADILAYIMSVNGMPAGGEELKGDVRDLADIKIARKTTWDGVFTTAQADRGKANFLAGRCGGCHKLDLSGDRGPALKGDDFVAHWENGSIATLFDKIRETMPPNAPNETTDDAKIDIVAYLLQQNGYPGGKNELRTEPESLSIIDLVRKGQASTIPNFSLVQVVGCLAQGPGSAWTLTRTSEPVLTRDEEPSQTALRTAQGKALGAQTFQLVSVVPFNPGAHAGQKMEARGLLYKDEKDARLNLTSLATISSSCQ
ncbi:MAG TPA: c-type cytochrome [Vicinamibacterales bacterium]|nr:c-type cytochrome [Vicinamibacterales bacterium]